MVPGRQTVRLSCPSCLCHEAAVGGDGLFFPSHLMCVCVEHKGFRPARLLVKSIGYSCCNCLAHFKGQSTRHSWAKFALTYSLHSSFSYQIPGSLRAQLLQNYWDPGGHFPGVPWWGGVHIQAILCASDEMCGLLRRWGPRMCPCGCVQRHDGDHEN